jgi:hypothetical protein
MVTYQVGPQQPGPPNEADGPKHNKPKIDHKEPENTFKWKETAFKMTEAALTTFASVAILGYATTLPSNRIAL